MLELKNVFGDLIRFETQLWNLVDARLLADCDLPLSWFEPMQVIAQVPGCRVFDIAAELSITIGGTSKLVDRLEAAGLCRRLPNPQDGRSFLLQLTPAGRRRLASASEAFEDELARRLGTLVSGHSLQRFASTLHTLRAGLLGTEAGPNQSRTAS